MRGLQLLAFAVALAVMIGPGACAREPEPQPVELATCYDPPASETEG